MRWKKRDYPSPRHFSSFCASRKLHHAECKQVTTSKVRQQKSSVRAHTHTGDLPCKASGMTSKLKDAKFFHWTFPFINCLKNYRTLHISGCIAKIQKKTVYWMSRNNNGKAGQEGERWPFDNQVISCGKVGRVVLKVQLVLESMETLLTKSQLLHHKTRFSRMFGR